MSIGISQWRTSNGLQGSPIRIEGPLYSQPNIFPQPQGDTYACVKGGPTCRQLWLARFSSPRPVFVASTPRAVRVSTLIFGLPNHISDTLPFDVSTMGFPFCDCWLRRIEYYSTALSCHRYSPAQSSKRRTLFTEILSSIVPVYLTDVLIYCVTNSLVFLCLLAKCMD